DPEPYRRSGVVNTPGAMSMDERSGASENGIERAAHHDAVAHERPADGAQAMIDRVASAVDAAPLDRDAARVCSAPPLGGATVEHDRDLVAVGKLAYRVGVETGVVAGDDHQDSCAHRWSDYHAVPAGRVNGEIARRTFSSHLVEWGYTG